MGRMKKYQTEEERLEAKRKREAEYYQSNKTKRQLYYKERYKKLKDDEKKPTQPIKKVTIWGKHDIGEITYEADDDYNSGDYEGNII
jgi:hypothetical protein